MKRYTSLLFVMLCLCFLLHIGVAQAQYVPGYPYTTYPVPGTSLSYPQWNPALFNLQGFMAGYPFLFGSIFPYWAGIPSSTSKKSSKKEETKKPDLKVSLKTDNEVYDLDEPVIITFTVKNTGNGTGEIGFASTRQFDVTVNDQSGEVWCHSSHVQCEEDANVLVLDPGASKTFDAEWDQMGDVGLPVPPGTYTIEAFLTPLDDQYKKAASATVSVRSLPRMTSCQDLKERLRKIKKEQDAASGTGGGTLVTKKPSTYYGYGAGLGSLIGMGGPMAYAYAPSTMWSIPSYGGLFGGYSTSYFSGGFSGYRPRARAGDEATPVFIESDGIGYGSAFSGSLTGVGYAPSYGSTFGTGFAGFSTGFAAPYGGGIATGLTTKKPGYSLYGFGVSTGSQSFAGGYSAGFSGSLWGGAATSSLYGYGSFAGISGWSSVYYNYASGGGGGSSGGGTGGGGTGGDGGASEYSGTNVQVASVDEADIVKNDDAYIYMIKENGVRIVRAYPVDDMAEVSAITFPHPDFTPRQLYVDGNVLAIIGEEERGNETIQLQDGEAFVSSVQLRSTFTRVYLYDITDRAQVIRTRGIRFEARYVQSRKVGDTLHMVMNEDPPYDLVDEDLDDDRILLPLYTDTLLHGETRTKAEAVCDCEEVAYFPRYTEPRYLLVAGIPLHDPVKEIGTEVIFGDSEDVFASSENLYATSSGEEEGATLTLVYKFNFANEAITYASSAKVEGTIVNQFSMQEYDDHFTIATTSESPVNNHLYIFNDQMRATGLLTDIAQGEEIECMRFRGDRCYMVTDRETDPFFVISLAEPENPVVVSELNILGECAYLHFYDDDHILGFGKIVQGGTELGMSVVMYDISDIQDPILVSEDEIGYKKTDSELLEDHKALLLNTSKDLMAFPVTETEYTSSTLHNYRYVFQGAYVYGIDGNGFSYETRITHHPASMFPGNAYTETGDHITRIISMGDYYYTVSEDRIKAIDMLDHTEEGTLAVQ